MSSSASLSDSPSGLSLRDALCLTFVHLSVLYASAAYSQEYSLDQSDYSRGQLFELYIKPDKLNDLKQDKSSITDFALPKIFLFPEDARIDKTTNLPRQNVLFGIDVSHHNGGDIDFEQFHIQNIRFAYVKASQGTRFKDKAFGKNWLKLSGMPNEVAIRRGAYHFLSAAGDAEEQASNFLEQLRINGGLRKQDLAPCLDLEWDRTRRSRDEWAGKSNQEIIASALKWLSIVEEKTGKIPAIYTAKSWWKERGLSDDQFKLFEKYPIWIADYSVSHKAVENPATIAGRKQDLWQFADDSRITSGYNRGIDANIFYGSAEEFDRVFSATK